MRIVRGWAIFILVLLAAAVAAAQTTYQSAPAEIGEILNAPPTPRVSVSPAHTHLLLVQGTRYPAIEDVARPWLGLAGLRIDPATNGAHMPPRYVAMTLRDLGSGAQTALALPADAYVSMPAWSPDGSRFAFTQRARNAVELWVGETATGQVRPVKGIALNATLGRTMQWMPDSRTLLVQTVAAGRGAPPQAPEVPPGPRVQESSGRAGPVRTFQDLLRGPEDEALFDHYATAQLALVDAATGKTTAVGKPAVMAGVEPSPDGKLLLVQRLARPYSYLHTAGAFPREIEVWDLSGKLVHKVASLPLADRVPIDGVRTGPRNVTWHPAAAAALVWVEALDEGDPRTKVTHRDRVRMLAAPFTAEAREVFRSEHRHAGMLLGERDGLALVSDYERDRRWTRTFAISLERPQAEPRLLWSRSVQDRYNHPGTPVMRTLPNGQSVPLQRGNSIFLSGPGAGPEGDRPFLDRYDLETGQTERLFQSSADSYEQVVAVLGGDGALLLTLHESPSDPPNYFIWENGQRTAVTRIPDPAPELRRIEKRLVTYKRNDGVDLSFTLYLPPGYQEGTRLPTVVWAYPQEFTDAGTAGQVTGSRQRFNAIAGTSHLFFLLRGYAILDGASMPVVGDPQTVNDTYIEQVVASARAAIEKAAELGVTDPERVGVGGHSYGAFMTANLLAHSDLFRAGIARSGAYNRTLTPFGFQAERRTLWEAPETYLQMSPFLAAHKIKAPVLFIHGEADNNSGTFPIQSERMYQAVRGNGGTARLVMLPHESHGYAARESVEHTLWEMMEWFDKHVKNAAPRRAAEGGQ